MPRMDWSLIAESHQFGIYRSVSSVKAWWAKFTAYAIANRLVRSRPAEYPTTHGSSPHRAVTLAALLCRPLASTFGSRPLSREGAAGTTRHEETR